MKKLAVLACFLLTGCAATMEMQGRKGPDLNLIKAGMTREDAQKILGAPVQVYDNPNGRLEVYEYLPPKKGNKAVAAGHAALSIASLGIWEVVGVPMEMGSSRSGTKERLGIAYNSSGIAIEVRPLGMGEVIGPTNEGRPRPAADPGKV